MTKFMLSGRTARSNPDEVRTLVQLRTSNKPITIKGLTVYAPSNHIFEVALMNFPASIVPMDPIPVEGSGTSTLVVAQGGTGMQRFEQAFDGVVNRLIYNFSMEDKVVTLGAIPLIDFVVPTSSIMTVRSRGEGCSVNVIWDE